MQITVNGSPRTVVEGTTLLELLNSLGLQPGRVAVEVNGEVIPAARHAGTILMPSSTLEIVTLVGGGSPFTDSNLQIGEFHFKNRLFTGTGKYATLELMAECLAASGCEVTTVAVRRERLVDSSGRSILDHLDLAKLTILPNTAGCFSAEEAIRHARLGRELLTNLGNKGAGWVKLECLGDKRTLLPDPIETLKATEILVSEGFTVLVYTSDDPILARRLQAAGAACVMPAGSPIGSGQGVLNANNIRIILEDLKGRKADYPVIVDAGVGVPSDVSFAMELGCDGVLLNTAVAQAADPLRMARAMGLACEAGRLGYLAGRIPKKLYAQASSPTEGMISPAVR